MDVVELINKELEKIYKRKNEISEEIIKLSQNNMSDLSENYDDYYLRAYLYNNKMYYINLLRRKKIILYKLRIEINVNKNLYKNIIFIIGNYIKSDIKTKLFNILSKYQNSINDLETQLKKLLDRLNILIAHEIIKVDEEIEFLVEETDREKTELDIKRKLYFDQSSINKMFIESYKNEIEELDKKNTILSFLLSTFSGNLIKEDKQEEWYNFIETNFKESYKFTFKIVYDIYIIINNKNQNEIITNRVMIKYIFNNYFIDSDKYIEMLNDRFKIK